jgi:hypothetical protein
MRLALWLVLLSVIAAGCLGGSNANRLLVLSGFTQLLMPIAETRDEIFQAWEHTEG